MIAIDSHVKPPKTGKMKRAANNKAKQAFEAYAEAYKAVYGVRPVEYRFDTASKMLYIGTAAGVTLKRLGEMTKQLRYRRG